MRLRVAKCGSTRFLCCRHRATRACVCGCVQVGFEEVERFAFYERAKKGFAVVATGCGHAQHNVSSNCDNTMVVLLCGAGRRHCTGTSY